MIPITSKEEFERRNKAWHHDNEMLEKYGRLYGMSNARDDYHYWHEEITDKPGCNRHDYPLAYSNQHYFRRFAELFFSTGAERRILPMLADQFLGDEVDADYINGLLISAEQYGFFNPGASIIFNGSVMQYAPPPASGERYSVYPPEVGFQEVYEGSKANKERAKVIRKWLKRRAKKLRQEGALEAEPPQVVGSTANEREASLAGLLSFGISPTEVVDLITRTLFAPGSDAPQPNANLRAYAIADALHLRGVITLSKTAFAALIGRGWGVSVGRRRNDPGPVWDELIGPLRDDVLRMRTNAQARPRKP